MLFVGRMVPEKGVEDLLDAYEEISQDGSVEGLQLLVVGEGPLLGTLKERCSRKGRGSVVFTGFVAPDKLYPYYAAADVFVLPSRYEPFGVVVHEAAAAGLPVIVSDCCGAAAELVEDERNGFIFRAGDARELAGAIEKLCRSGDRWDRMGCDSRRLAKMYDYNEGERQFVEMVRTAMS